MLSELFANLALEGWVREREPASLPALRTFPRCFATIDSTRFAVTALERMDRGLYGTCTRCEVFLPLDRLRLAPHVQQCASCAGETRLTA